MLELAPVKDGRAAEDKADEELVYQLLRLADHWLREAALALPNLLCDEVAGTSTSGDRT